MERHENGERKWHELPDDFISELQKSAQLIDGLSEDAATEDVRQLNAMLDYGNVIGQTVQLKSSLVMVNKEFTSDGTLVFEPVFEGQLLTKETIVGVFSGVSSFMETEEKRALIHILSFEFEDEGYTAMAPVNGSRLRIANTIEQQANDTDPDWLTEQAFQTLEQVDDENYSMIVNFLREDYEDEDGDKELSARMRTIGATVAQLVSHPLIDDAQQKQALHNILMNSFDTELRYAFKADAAESSSIVSIQDEGVFEQFIFIPNYKINKDSEGKKYRQENNGTQVGMQIKTDSGSFVTIPLQYIHSMTERPTEPASCESFNNKVRKKVRAAK